MSFLLILKAERNNESSHAYSEFKSKFDDSENELSHAGSNSGLKKGKVFK
jgi:hypothetical protein